MADLLDRITINPDQCGGRPCIRGMRIRVTDVLDLLAAGQGPDKPRPVKKLQRCSEGAALRHGGAPLLSVDRDPGLELDPYAQKHKNG